MFNSVKTFYREWMDYRARRLKEDEFLAALTYPQWKTRNRVLEEVNKARENAGLPLLPMGSWLNAVRVKSSIWPMVSRLEGAGIIEVRREPFPDGDVSWFLRDSSGLDEAEVGSRRSHDLPDPPAFRKAGGSVFL